MAERERGVDLAELAVAAEARDRVLAVEPEVAHGRDGPVQVGGSGRDEAALEGV